MPGVQVRRRTVVSFTLGQWGGFKALQEAGLCPAFVGLVYPGTRDAGYKWTITVEGAIPAGFVVVS